MSAIPTLENLPAEIKLNIRMEAIFMPGARTKRDNFLTGSKRFAHYTSAENALKIIQSKRLWMRNTTCMADFREVEHGYQMLRGYFSDESKRTQFVSALDKCATDAVNDALNLFNQWWTYIRFNTYIASISEHADLEDSHGRLSMWRAFGKDLAKVAIVFRIPTFSSASDALKLMFSPVLYLNRESLQSHLDQVLANVKLESEFLCGLDRSIIVTWLFTMLIGAVTCVKHEGFEEEREWRAIYSPKKATSILMEPTIEVVSGIPQTIYQIPLDKAVSLDLESLDFAAIFDRIILGPSQYPFVMAEAFEKALVEAGVADAGQRICASEIPLRT